MSQALRKRGVPHEVLNAKQHAREAHVVAQAGRKGAVTVATNMAGRGTDIMLGGNPEFMASAELEQRGLTPSETPEEYEAAWPDALHKAEESVKREHEEVVDLGGLYVLGTERHECRRIDNQLRGRSGRQGDPGESRFYLSLEDDLMRLFKSGVVDRVLTTFDIPDDVPIEAKMVSNAIASAQTQVERQNFEIRKNVLKYDDVMNTQRQVVYAERQRVLNGEDLVEQIRGMVDDTITDYVISATAEGFPEEWDLEQLWTALGTLYPVGPTLDEVVEEAGGDVNGLTSDFLLEHLLDDAHGAYGHREEELGSEAMRELERRVVLSVVDRKWREHLYEMDYLKEGIGLRAMAQRDPLVEYQREGFELFAAMMDSVKEESVGLLFNVEVQVNDPNAAAAAQVTPQGALPGVSGAGGGAGPLSGSDAQSVIAALAGGQKPLVTAKGLQAGGPKQVQYSAPGETGDVVRTGGDVGADAGEPVVVDPNASRAERRRAERANKKRRR